MRRELPEIDLDGREVPSEILEDLVRRAVLHALRADMGADIVPMKFSEQALRETRPSVTPEMEREYEQTAETLKQESPRGRRIGFALEREAHGAGTRAAAD